MTDAPEDEKTLAETLTAVLGARYAYVSRLGAGAFGEVYRVHDTMLDRDVAVKRVRLDAFADTAQRGEMRERTIREARVAARIQHPHIVTIFDIVDLPDMSFILMEFIEGRTLGELLKEKGRLSFEETVRILGQTADALDFAHAKGVVHRDIKPANVMIDAAKGQVKVTDFGIAKSDSLTELTAAGSILGTPNYMSPEQARGDASIDHRTDLFALGCVLYECLSGKKAFRGKNVMATLMTIMNDAPAPVDYSVLGLPPELSLVLKRALAKDPDERFTTGHELVAALVSLPTAEAPTIAITTAIPPPIEAPVVTRRERGSTSSFDVCLQGSLSEISVAELIRDVYSSRSTGILHVKHDDVGKRIYMKKGNVVFANSDVEDDRLGEFLIRGGRIDRATFDAASAAMQRTGQRMGKALVEIEAIGESELDGLVRAQVIEIVFSVFDWNMGSYGFELLDRPVEEDIVVELSTAELILQGVRRIASLERVREALGGTGRVLRHTENPLLLYQKMTLTPSEGFVLSRVDGATTVAEIAAISPLGEEETLRCVYALVAAGVVELTIKTAPATSRLSSKSGAEGGSHQSEEAKSWTPAPPEQAAARTETAATGTNQESTAGEKVILDEIAAKHASLETADLYGLLETSAGASSEELKRAYYAMAKRYHPDRHHLPHLREAQGLLEELFAKISDAYELLSDPVERRRYDGRRQDNRRADVEKKQEPEADSAPPQLIAERQYQKGLNHFEQMEYFDAIQCVRESVRMVPGDPRYRKLLARSLAKNPKWLKEAETHFLEALKADEFDIECFLGLAETYESAKLSTRAAKIYEKILAYDPDNLVALERLHGKASKGRSKRSRPKKAH